MRSTVSMLTIALALAACSSTPTKTETPPAAAPAAQPPQASAKPTTSNPVVGNPLTDPNNILSKRSVYFAYDQFVLRETDRPLIQAHAAYLSAHHDARAKIEGNADERGSSEYNLALGQKRAEAVKKTMVLLGALNAQLETVSFGKEKPKAPGHDEAAWAENRRADIRYSSE